MPTSNRSLARYPSNPSLKCVCFISINSWSFLLTFTTVPRGSTFDSSVPFPNLGHPTLSSLLMLGVVTIGPWPQLHVGSRGHFWCGRHAVRRSSCGSETSETFSDRGWQSTCPPWKSHFLRHLFRSHQTSGFEWIWLDHIWFSEQSLCCFVSH